MNVSVPSLKSFANPAGFLSDAFTGLGEYAADALGLDGLWQSVKNVQTVGQALYNVHSEAHDLLEYGITNFETISAEEFDQRSDTLFRNTLNEFNGALRSVTGLPESPLVDYLTGVNFSVGPLEAEATVELSIGRPRPQIPGLTPDLPLPQSLPQGQSDSGELILLNEAVQDYTGSPFRDVVFSLGGETFTNEPGNERFFDLSGGNDVFVGGPGSDFVFGGTGNDDIRAGSGQDLVSGGDPFGPSADGNDRIFGEEGDDYVEAGYGQDTMNGGPGRDTVTFDRLMDAGGVRADLASGTVDLFANNTTYRHIIAEFETLRGTDRNDTLLGSTRSDELEGALGDDTLRGAGGNDDLEGGAGANLLDGGPGFDRAEYDNFQVSSGIWGHIGQSVVTGMNSDLPFIDTLISVEAIEGSRHNDTLFGSAQNDRLEGDEGNDNVTGGAGNDTLLGDEGADTINGGGGDDIIDGGPGIDTLIGGPGSDRITIDDPTDRIVESRNWAGTDTVVSSVDFRLGSLHVENLFLTGTARVAAGNGLVNELRGNREANILDGGKNNDIMRGGAGNDTYFVRAPGDTVIEAVARGLADTVLAFRSYRLPDNVERLFMQTVYTKDGSPAIFNGIGNGLDNTIVGTPFSNTIVGREGRDTLKGQAGGDTFVFDRALGPDNVDRIIDFNTNEANEGDILKMKGTVFSGMAAGALSAADFVAGTAAADASDRFIFDQASGQLWFDADGSGAGAQELVATFEQNATVTAADIEIF
ncbi:calcium-binding protein [Roseovarius aestuariivivens]|uniref:calcium-binding protein n=1 Tax=Roseovarius aestuariivivens TaxID=1888910 RepID=UPI00143675BF|nr:calcium-binding protein [Roseovarius aestuariivivens]